MPDHGGMAGDADVAIPGGGVLSGDELGDGIADADALEVWQHDDTMLTAEIEDGVMRLQNDGDEGNGNVVPGGEVAFGGGVEIGAQIMMPPK